MNDIVLDILFPLLQGGFGGFIACLVLILALLIGLNFSDKIKDANAELIDANPTTISNPIIFKIFGFIFFIGITANFLLSIAMSVDGVDSFTGFYYFVQDLLALVILTFVGFAVSNLYFQPDKVNIKVDKSSTVAEDFIALLTFGLKVPLALSKMLSQAIILIGVFLLFFGVIDLLTGTDFFGVIGAIATVITGAFAPFLFYLLFLFLFPIFNLYLAILYIPKIGKDK